MSGFLNVTRHIHGSALAAFVGLGCAGDDSSGSSGETGHSHETETGQAQDTGTSSGSTGSSETGHAESSETGHATTTTDGGSSGGQGVTPDAYCDCLLVNCHEPYHDMWGESDVDAAMNCREAAAEVPQNGAPTMEGDFLECRIAHCELAADDAMQCDAALGAAPCQ